MRSKLWTAAALAAALASACSSSSDGTDGDADADADGDADADSALDGSLADWCAEGCACSDGQDNDGDGLVDGFDPECISPYDNDEGTFATGIPGDNRDPNWQDCFFDGNSGAGDDGCRYSTECLTDPENTREDCTVVDQCAEFCLPMVPNGCDCFGCCTVYDDAGEAHLIVISESCTVETLDDPRACVPCVPTDDCSNVCGECELCMGRTVEDLPESCFDEPDGGPGDAGTDSGTNPPWECEGGITCGPELPCAEGSWCSNGCCLVAPI